MLPVRSGLTALVVLALLTGCGGGAPKANPARPDPTVATSESPVASSAAPSGAPASRPAASTSAKAAGGPAAAAAFVGRQAGTLGVVVRDRTTGQVWRAGATRETTWTASTIKLAIAADLLERHRSGSISLDATDRANLDKALINSDNDATTALWSRYDGPGMLPRFRTRFGMGSLAVVAGQESFWRNLRCSAEDLQALMSYVLERTAADDRTYLVTTLRKVSGSQRWGVWAAGSGLRPGNKAGWAQKPVDGRTVWVTHTVGFAGPGERYVVAAMYRQGGDGTLAKGVHVVSDAIALYFDAKVPAPVQVP